MNLLDSVILGALEGLTEFLPISSTGHLILASSLLGLPASEFLKTFQIAVQLGAIAAVVALYGRMLLDLELLKRLLVAFLPTGVLGFLLYPYIKGFLLGSTTVVLWALFIGGIALVIFELMHKESTAPPEALASLPYGQAFTVGLFQSLAMIPGVSRSAATIVGGLLLGMRRVAIVEFSFLLAVPTMLAATGYDLLKSRDAFASGDALLLAVGFATSFIVALLSMRFLLSFVRNHSFIPFGIYRILLAAVFFLVVL